MKLIDLTLPLEDGMQLLPILPKLSISEHLNFENSAEMYKPPCVGVTIKKLEMPDHVGTHIDAPIHFIPGGKDISQVPLERLAGKAVMIDCTKKDPFTPLTLQMFEEYMEEQNVNIVEDDILIMKFWPKKWGVDGYFECRTLTPEVADFLIDAKVKLVGVDAMSVDCLEDKSRPVHMKLLKEEIIAVECLVNLDKIPTRQFQFMALPLPLKNAAGSPTRAVAIM